ncbi:MAG: hypothetical protein PF484_15065 [Bacteroidales bacterium]|jgi:hypothetical protein|nr:hypothetical protein [Bacteroidales bacterium]
MRTIVFFLVFFLSFIHNVVAQQWIENGSLGSIKIDLKYKRANDLIQNEMNRILSSIAYTHQKPVEITNVKWELISSYQVFREEKGNFKSEIFIKPLAPEGDLNLYKFNSAEYILPILHSFRLRIFKEDSSLVYVKQFQEIPISVNSAGQIAHFSILHQRWAKGWYMEIDQFEFKDLERDYTFEQWFQYTNDYEAANYLINSLSKTYRQLQQSLQEPSAFLIKSFRQVDYLEKLSQMPFYKATVIDGKDPDNLQQKVKIMSTLFELNIEKYATLLKNYVITESFSIEHLVDAYLLEDENILTLQDNYNGIYDDLFKQLARSNYPNNLSYENFTFFEIVGSDNVEIYKIISSFENLLYSKSIDNIDNLIDNQQFAESLFALGNLEKFIVNSKTLELNEFFNQYKAKSAYGMYYSYINVADQAIKIKNTNLALQYIKKAGIVQETYPKLILTNSLVEKKLWQLLDVYYSDYNYMIVQNGSSDFDSKRDSIRDLIISFRFAGSEELLNQLFLIDKGFN